MSLKSWGDIVSEARAEIWPFPAEAKPLVAAHSRYFKLAAMDLQDCIPELQVNNTSQFRFCTTYFNCGLTVVESPVGIPKRVYTIANSDWCDRVRYRRASHAEVMCWARNRLTYTSPENEGAEALPMGFRYAEASTDSDCGRARTGIWSIDRGRLHVAPWIQSNETLVVEWDGIKKEWADDDMLDTEWWDDRVINAIKLFVKWYHEKFHGTDIQLRRELERDYRDARADLIHYFEQITKQHQEEAECEDRRLPTSDEIEDDETEEDSELVFAIIGDWGDPDYPTAEAPAVLDVEELVTGWDPEFIVTVGDNRYGCTFADLFAVATGFKEFVDNELMFPAIGNHDTNDGNGLSEYLEVFSYLPKNYRGHNRYYDFVRSNVHFFIMNVNESGTLEDDGRGEGSIQAAWLQTRLAQSTAQFKVVVTQDGPYNSDANLSNYPGHDHARLPYKQWGADVVIAGDSHFYERLEVGELPYIVNGAGGASRASFNASPHSGSIIRYRDAHGAMKCTATCGELTFEFYNVSGTLIDTLTLTK